MTITMRQYADLYFLSDTEVTERIGNTIKTVRLNGNITRDELQRITGVHKKTIGDAEAGKNITMMTLVAILRGLNMLDQLDGLLTEDGVSPVIMAKTKGKTPKRATGKG